MAITGKFWSAILFRQIDSQYPLTTTTHLVYTTGPNGGGNNAAQTLADIQTYYPDLTWDTATTVVNNGMWLEYLPQFYDNFSIDAETYMLDLQNYLETGGGFIYPEGLIHNRYNADYGGWLTTDPYSSEDLAGAPSYSAAFYPDANTWNETTPTPFGDYGNGLIRDQALYHYSDYTATGGVDDPIAGPYPDSIPGRVNFVTDTSVVDRTFIFTPTRDSAPDTPPSVPNPDGQGDGVTDNDVNLRCWTYSLDGHDYYVLRVGQSTTLVYDLTTGSWSEWRSPGRFNWRAHVGCNWVGMSATTLNRGWGSDVVAGDDASGVLWILNPAVGRDDRSTTGSDYITRVVIGGIQMTSRDSIPCNAVELDVALGHASQPLAAFTLETSDDFGHSWDNQGTVTIDTTDFTQVCEWRSLGNISYPGRIFRFTDNGATVRFSGADMR